LDLIGIDVGFSETRASTGIARLSDSGLSIGLATRDWESRSECIGSCEGADVVAIDAPLLSQVSNEYRSCERTFVLGKFQRRCKPGLSHIAGTGRRLRNAGWETANQISPIASGRSLTADFPRMIDGMNIVEAFPNAFLGVMLSDSCYDYCYGETPGPGRGKKFDWLYQKCCAEDVFGKFMEYLPSIADSSFLEVAIATRNHDKRAALICLLTAACVAEADKGPYRRLRLTQQGCWTTIHLLRHGVEDEI